MWGAIDRNGPGVGYGYYAIVGSGIAVSGRLADKHGKGIPRGGIPAGPGGSTPDPGVVIEFSAKRHGVLTPLVSAGDLFEHIRCSTRVLRVTHAIRNFNFHCT
jgi:hypothetical protein